MLFEHFLCRLFLCLLGYINTWAFTVAVFQIEFGVSQELVVFCEHRNDRNFETNVLQTVASVLDDLPF